MLVELLNSDRKAISLNEEFDLNNGAFDAGKKNMKRLMTPLLRPIGLLGWFSLKMMKK